MPMLYLTSANGPIALDVDRGMVVGAPKEHKNQMTRAVTVRGAMAYILDTPANLQALGVDPVKMAVKVKPPKAAAARQPARGKRKPAPAEAPAE